MGNLTGIRRKKNWRKITDFLGNILNLMREMEAGKAMVLN